ncbi:MAG: 4-hydroxy-3-methylbut-2-enyl diphosphate reductase [Holdemanella sp.]|nr:4-hydroxy-3-methylbut-2-enyl diphosphate reductase [Holdemanella sp.]
MKQFDIHMVKPQGYCGGVLKAIDSAILTRKKNPNKTITILGNLVHNQFVKKALSYYKIGTVDNKNKTRLELLDEIQEGIVIFTAHGIGKEVYQKAMEKGLEIVDASCPFVLTTQKIVHSKLEDGFVVFYIGKNKHPEAEAIYLNEKNVYLIEHIEDIPKNIKEKIFVTNQTTMSILDIKEIFDEIKRIYPDALIHDEICNATRVRQQAILNLKNQGFNTLIVVGDPTSNNTKQLAMIGKKADIPQIIKVESVEDIHLDSLKDASKIAITSGASTPTYLTNQIYEYLMNQKDKPEIKVNEILNG